MGQALYRKYRSKSLSEIVGQEHITTALEHALKQGTISHAYLFSGPRGVGKTSVARILAHAVNDVPYNDDSAHLDIIEIDAASHRRIDEIRELRERAYIAPTSAKYKVYIIDEVHMLTREAFNALLKILEEPPAHVIFILATTEAHKLPETIISRTQRFTFRPAETTKATAHLKSIAAAEKIAIDDDALELIAVHGEGSFRDSISLLDQVRNRRGRVTRADVEAAIGQAPVELVDALRQAIEAQGVARAVAALTSLREQGYEAAGIAKQLGERWRADLLAGHSSLPRSASLRFLSQLIEMPVSPNPSVALELAVLESISEQQPTKVASTQHDIQPRPAPEPARPAKVAAAAAKPTTSQTKTTKQPQAPAKPFDEATWSAVLDTIKQTHNTLYGALRMAEPTWEDGHVTLAFRFAFHQKRINEAQNRQVIVDAIAALTGQDVALDSIVDESLPSNLPTSEPEDSTEAPPLPDDPTIENISNIFGGAELLES